MSLSPSMTRRQLLACAMCAAAQLVLKPASLFGAADPHDVTPDAGSSGAKALYCFILLGDIHYDAPEHHDMEWLRKAYPNDLRQIENYCKVTANHTPRLMGRVKQIIEQSATPVAFVVQNGDFSEGLCGSFDLHSKQLQDATGMVDQMGFGVPFLVNKGNHDITGPGAPEAYDKVMFPWLTKQAGEQISSATYLRRQGDDLFVFFDAYKPNLEWLEQAFKKHSDAKQTFFFTHTPVVPADARATGASSVELKRRAIGRS